MESTHKLSNEPVYSYNKLSAYALKYQWASLA